MSIKYAAAEAIGKPIYLIYPEEKKDIGQSEIIALLEGKGMSRQSLYLETI